jgi:predicted nuclease of restriction endonuclease-like (RecB) superfamily
LKPQTGASSARFLWALARNARIFSFTYPLRQIAGLSDFLDNMSYHIAIQPGSFGSFPCDRQNLANAHECNKRHIRKGCDNMLINNENYFKVLESIKARIRDAQYRAILGVNREQIVLFWNIGKVIIENSKYGSGFIENLARDIRSEFPNAKGYSVRNLRYMRRFAEMFDDIENLQAPLADLTWYHNQALMDKTKNVEEYLVCGENP